MDMNFDWSGKDFIIGRLKYWTGYADEAEITVSAANGWSISSGGDDNRSTILCYHNELEIGFSLALEKSENELKITLPKSAKAVLDFSQSIWV